MSVRLRAFALACLLALGCCGCGRGASSQAVSLHIPAQTEPSPSREDRTFTVGWSTADGFNPYLSTSVLTAQNAGLLFVPFVEISPAMEPEYRAADSIECSGTTVVIHLKGGLSFADGTPITIQDAKASLDAARASGAYAARFANLRSVRVRNESLVLELDQPDSLFAYLCDIPILKADEVGLSQPTASGPYTYAPGGMLVKNPRYSLSAGGPEEIRLFAVEGYDQMIRAFTMGDLNLYAPPLQSSDASGISSQELHYKTNHLVFLGVNAQSASPLLREEAGRSLLNRLVDRRALAQQSYFDRAYPAAGALNPYYPCAASQQVTGPAADLTGLEETMAALGYTLDADTGFYQKPSAPQSLEILVYSGSTQKKSAASLICRQLENAGIRAEVKALDDFTTYRAAVESGEFDLYIGEVKLYNNMDLSPFFAGGALSAHLAQSEPLQAAYAAFKENKSAAGSFETVFAAHAPYIPLVWRVGTLAASQDLSGLGCSLSNVFYSLQDLSFN
ncbi:MAG: hypothetical protein IIV90_01220 [Oscillospiraceae bacterium]|nr:hypothetical protein [Oscillospiraceae bacterium]